MVFDGFHAVSLRNVYDWISSDSHKQTYHVNQIDSSKDGAYNWDITAGRGAEST